MERKSHNNKVVKSSKDITILNVYVYNNIASKYIIKLIKLKVVKFIVGDISTW